MCFVGASQPPTSSYATAALSVQALQVTLSDASYDAAKVAPWTNTVIDTVLKGLVALGRPFKYIGGLASVCTTETRSVARAPCPVQPPFVLSFVLCSVVHHYAKERRGAAHGSGSSLGRQEGWHVRAGIQRSHCFAPHFA
jgi:hypothetical protein